MTAAILETNVFVHRLEKKTLKPFFMYIGAVIFYIVICNTK